MSGYADGTFRPGRNVTRGQLSKVVVLAKAWILIRPPVPRFTDVGLDNSFYTYVETAANKGIISGYQNGSFKPGVASTRGQVSKVVFLAITQP